MRIRNINCVQVRGDVPASGSQENERQKIRDMRRTSFLRNRESSPKTRRKEISLYIRAGSETKKIDFK